MSETKICHVCGATYSKPERSSSGVWGRRRYCSPACSNKAKHSHDLRNRLDKAETKVYITDEQQLELNKRIDNKTKITFAYKRYTPNDPEFQKIAQQIRPIQHIRKDTLPLIAGTNLYGVV